MRYSKLFGKTNKNAKAFDSKNATLLTKAGFIDQVMAGVYIYLPLGNRVLMKIENIIREEMNKVADEIFMSALAPKENWIKTGRLETVDVLFKVVGANEKSRLKNDAEYILNCTHEDMVTPLVAKFNKSYREFPFSVYQVQTKFRNEARSKSGILRGREFRMKDSYSFHTSEEDLLKYYDVMKGVYTKIFERLGLGESTVVALASGGDFTEEYSHEFQTITDAGEDILFKDVDSGIIYNREVTPSKAPAAKYKDDEKKQREDVLGQGIIGVEELASFLNIEVDRTTKTLLFKGDNEFIAVAVRGGYDVDEEKLKEVANVDSLRLATAEEVLELTGCVVGYLGPIGLPDSVRIIWDDSTEGRLNFECGANRENYHTINANFGVDVDKPEQFFDVKVAKEGDLSPETGRAYEVFKAAEVGNIFPLNTKFSDAFGYKFTDEGGYEKPIYMGCYGIGSTRAMGVIVEKSNDDKGIIWPKSVTPYHVHLVSLGKDGEDSLKIAENLVDELEEKGIEVLWDDRDINAGEKFNDADLIGIPVRLVVSKKSLEKGGVEVKIRNTGEEKYLSIEEIVDYVGAFYA